MEHIDVIIFFGAIAFFTWFGPRLENSMDEAIIGKRVADHKYLWWNIIAALVMAFGVFFWAVLEYA